MLVKLQTKILESGFYWPTLFRGAHNFVKPCDRCQRTRNIVKRDEMSQNFVIVCEIFGIRVIDFMGPLPTSKGNRYILVVVDMHLNRLKLKLCL